MTDFTTTLTVDLRIQVVSGGDVRDRCKVIAALHELAMRDDFGYAPSGTTYVMRNGTTVHEEYRTEVRHNGVPLLVKSR